MHPEALEPGDLLLFSDQAKNPVMSLQAIVGDTKDLRWTHAAIFLGGQAICEAIPNEGVVVTSVYERLLKKKQRMRARRSPHHSREERARIASQALHYLGVSYPGLDGLVRRWLEGSPINADLDSSVLCSELYHRIFTLTLRSNLGALFAGTVITPAWLSQCENLEDVSMSWVTIP